MTGLGFSASPRADFDMLHDRCHDDVAVLTARLQAVYSLETDLSREPNCQPTTWLADEPRQPASGEPRWGSSFPKIR